MSDIRLEPGVVRITINGRSAFVRKVDVGAEVRSPWDRSPMIFGAFERWKSPWWARAIAWGIAAWMAVQRG